MQRPAVCGRVSSVEKVPALALLDMLRTGAVCGPSQRTKRGATTRRDTNQRRVFSLVGAVVEALIRRPT